MYGARKMSHSMEKELLDEFISLSDKMRCGYKSSLGIPHREWEQLLTNINRPIPKIYREIYSTFAGTPRDIKEQKLMDFIPGYRLIHIEELDVEYNTFMRMVGSDAICENQIEIVIPLLADYASNYICYVKKQDNTEAIFGYSTDEGFVGMHKSLEKFFETIIAFYKEDVYFLDDDGFLDYDFEKAGAIGGRLNPGIEYWTE